MFECAIEFSDRILIRKRQTTEERKSEKESVQLIGGSFLRVWVGKLCELSC